MPVVGIRRVQTTSQSQRYLLSLEPHDVRDGPALCEGAGVRERRMRQVQEILQAAKQQYQQLKLDAAQAVPALLPYRDAEI